MEDMEKLIQTIISEGNKKAKQILADAENQADSILKSAQEREAKFIDEQVALAKQENENKLKLAKSSAVYRLNKLLLKEKNDIIDNVFSSLLERFCALSENQYEDFLSAVLDKANVGDEINYSKRPGEAKRISNLAVFKQKQLRLGKVIDNVSGGVVISNSVCNKDFSFEGLIKEKRENSIRHVAGLLF